MNPRFNDAAIEAMYGKGYYEGSAGFSYIDERQKERNASYVWRARLRTIRTYVNAGNFLDIGASFGGFMNEAARWFTPYGIELSSYSGGFAKERFGDTLHIGTLSDHPFPSSFFSVITMVELIEHLADPMSALKQCQELLAPGGVLVIQTADCAAWQAVEAGAAYHYYLPGHLSCFTESSLCEAIQRAGFTSYKVFRPVDFGLLPKLRKMRGDFKSCKDYRRWIPTALYHFKGYFRKKGKPLTSSMVVYAFK
jgi:SAM-dependent methyltransferase